MRGAAAAGAAGTLRSADKASDRASPAPDASNANADARPCDMWGFFYSYLARFFFKAGTKSCTEIKARTQVHTQKCWQAAVTHNSIKLAVARLSLFKKSRKSGSFGTRKLMPESYFYLSHGARTKQYQLEGREKLFRLGY
jgi:hypothetical protein